MRRLDTTSTEQRGKQSREGNPRDEKNQEVIRTMEALESNTQAFLFDVGQLFEARNSRPEASHLQILKYVFATAIEDIGNEYPSPYSQTDYQISWKMYKYLKWKL